MTELLMLLFLLLASGQVAMFTCCCGGTCSNCSGSTPATIQVIIAGMADADCTSCTGYNATFVLPLATLGTCTALGPCNFEYTRGVAVNGGGTCTSGSISDNSYVSAIIGLSGSDYILTVRLIRLTVIFGNHCFNVTTFIKNFGTSPPDCAAWSSLDVPWSTDLGTYCNGTAATCTATAL